MAAVVVVTAPTAGEMLPKGTAYTVTWTDADALPTYTVDLYKGGAFVSNIATDVGGLSTSFTPDTGLTSGSDYTIKVTNDSGGGSTGESEQFTIYTLHSVAISETVSVSDALEDEVNLLKAIAEIVNVSDSLSTFIDHFRAIVETVNVRDSMIVSLIVSGYYHYVYHLDFDNWTKFTDIDVMWAATLSRGSQMENVTLLLNSSKEVDKYPGGDQTSKDASIVTKIFSYSRMILKKIWADFTSTPQLSSVVYNEDFASPYYKENIISSPQKKTWRGIANGYNRGDSFELRISNADIIKSMKCVVEVIGE